MLCCFCSFQCINTKKVEENERNSHPITTEFPADTVAPNLNVVAIVTLQAGSFPELKYDVGEDGIPVLLLQRGFEAKAAFVVVVCYFR